MFESVSEQLGDHLSRIFLDTSVVSHKSLSELAKKLAEQESERDELLISVLTHFEVLEISKDEVFHWRPF